jgi:hypothetical protein
VVHQGQRLPFGIEAGEYRLRVASAFDELQRDLPSDGLGLLRQVHRSHAALAENPNERVSAGDDLAKGVVRCLDSCRGDANGNGGCFG